MLHVDFKKILAGAITKEREFLPIHLPRELKELYLTMTMLNFALASGMLFEPIYLYTLRFSLSEIMLYYFAVYALYFFLMPLGGRFVKRYGFEHGIIFGSLFLVAYFLFLLAIPFSPFFTVCAVVSLAMQKTFFWPGYHADFAFFSKAEERGREVSIIALLDSFSYIAGPLVGGVLISLFGFAGLFAVMCAMILLSNIPLMTTKERFKPSTLSYSEPYAALIAKENRRYLFAYIGFGEELVSLAVWPIFIYVTFTTFANTGAAITFSTLITSLAILYVGRQTDRADRKKILRISTLLLSLSWVLRVFVRGASAVIFADFFSRTSRYLFAMPLFSGLYKHATQTSIVRTVIFFEMALTVGKMIAAALLAVIFYYVPEYSAWNIAFAVAAMFSLLYFFLSRNHQIDTPRRPSEDDIYPPCKL
ncbi:MFS transporter [Candidatus Uhrbacteria bacterium]|nr:MFS transporter [Candidatus Uhrbacteria bacterium]